MFFKMLSAALVLAGAFCEFGLFLNLILDTHLIQIITYHLLSISCWISAFIIKVRKDEKKEPDVPRILYCLIVSAFFPVIGPVFSAVFLMSFMVFGKKMREGVYEDFDEYLFDFSVQEQSELNQRQMIRKAREELGFEPLTDIMMGSETKLKIKAVDKLSKDVRIENVRLLQHATKDEAHEVRLYASSALLKMEASIGEKISFASAASAKLHTASSFADLGNLYKSYAESGFLESTLAAHYLRMAAQAYRKSLDKKTDQPETVANYAVCLMETGEVERAMKILDRMTQLWPDNQRLLFLSAQARFKTGRTGQIPELLSRINRKSVPEPWAPVLEYWTS